MRKIRDADYRDLWESYQETGDPALKQKLVAAEPDIHKPLNLAFDERGRLWVTDSVEYPYAAPADKGRDSIRILEDRNGDGRADVIKVFADGLNIPIGLYPYRDGVVAYSIPNISFIQDGVIFSQAIA